MRQIFICDERKEQVYNIIPRAAVALLLVGLVQAIRLELVAPVTQGVIHLRAFLQVENTSDMGPRVHFRCRMMDCVSRERIMQKYAPTVELKFRVNVYPSCREDTTSYCIIHDKIHKSNMDLMYESTRY